MRQSSECLHIPVEVDGSLWIWHHALYRHQKSQGDSMSPELVQGKQYEPSTISKQESPDHLPPEDGPWLVSEACWHLTPVHQKKNGEDFLSD